MMVVAPKVWKYTAGNENAWRETQYELVGVAMITSWNGNIFRVTGHLCGEFTGQRWIPRTKASDAENVSIPWRYRIK